MVAKAVVLSGIEHLQHRRGWITPEVSAHLVDLIDHENRVARLGIAQGADYRPRQRPDICAPVAPDLCLVANAADRDPLKLAPQSPGNRAS